MSFMDTFCLLFPSVRDNKGHRHFFGIFSMSCRVFLVEFPLLIVLSLLTEKAWGDPNFQNPTQKFYIITGITVKYAKNSLDLYPLQGIRGTQPITHRNRQEISSKFRLLRPCQLVFLKNVRWALTSKMHCCKYLFFS